MARGLVVVVKRSRWCRCDMVGLHGLCGWHGRSTELPRGRSGRFRTAGNGHGMSENHPGQPRSVLQQLPTPTPCGRGVVGSGIDFPKRNLCRNAPRAGPEPAPLWAPQANNFWADPATELTGITNSWNQTVRLTQMGLDAFMMLWGDALATADSGAPPGGPPLPPSRQICSRDPRRAGHPTIGHQRLHLLL